MITTTCSLFKVEFVHYVVKHNNADFVSIIATRQEG